MKKLPLNVEKRLDLRKEQGIFRELGPNHSLVDFSSNDFLGFASNQKIFSESHRLVKEQNSPINGSTGSRLLTGNHDLYREAEKRIASFHQSPDALIFNSGYDANLGLIGGVPQRNDTVLYDAFCHASIRDGLLMAQCRSYKFLHNDTADLERKIRRLRTSHPSGVLYLVTEAVFSMDGDTAPLAEISAMAERYECFLIVDEAHATGIRGLKGEGLAAEVGIQNLLFAQTVTFGKSLGIHGAAILCSTDLKQYLINFGRSLIYSTALSPHSVAAIIAAYNQLEEKGPAERNKLHQRINFFEEQVKKYDLEERFSGNGSGIRSCLIPGNDRVRKVSEILKQEGMDVRPIFSPTVPRNQERLRICLHSFNSEEEILNLIKVLYEALQK